MSESIVVTFAMTPKDQSTDQHVSLSWDEFVGLASVHDVREDKESRTDGLPVAIALASFAPTCACGGDSCARERGHKITANVDRVWVTGWDLDREATGGAITQETVSHVFAKLDELGVEYVAHTTHSYDGVARFSWRVFLRQSRGVTQDEWRGYHASAAAYLQIPSGLVARPDPRRIWYLPSCRPGTAPRVLRREGKPLDVDALLATAPPIPEPRAATVRIAPVGELAERVERGRQAIRNELAPLGLGCAPVPETSERAELRAILDGSALPGMFASGNQKANRLGIAIAGLAPDIGMDAAWEIIKSSVERSVGVDAHSIDRLEARVCDGYEWRASQVSTADPATPESPPSVHGSRAPTTRYGTDAADFLAVDDDGEDPWIVPGLVPEGMPAMLVGPPKSGKSWFELSIAVSVALGLPVLGRQVRRTRVLVIAREDTARETRRRVRLICRGLDVEPESLRGWLSISCSQPLYLDDGDHYAALDATITDFRPGLVLIDSLSRIHTAEENSRSEMAIVTNRWADLCQRHNATILILHHVIKSEGGTLMQRIRGTGDLGAVVRVAIGLEPKGARGVTRRLEVDGNLAGMSSPLEVRLVDLIAGGARFELAGTASVVNDTDPLRDPMVGVLAKVLAAPGSQQMTVLELRRGRGGRAGVDAALAVMATAGLIEPVWQGRRHCGYQLTAGGLEFAAGR